MTEQIPVPPRSTYMDPETQRIIEEAKSRAAYDVAFPHPKQLTGRIGLIARLTGRIPDAYDILAAGVQLELLESIRDNRKFDWEKVGDHPLIQKLQEMTVSMGGGKGRREIVEMARTSNPPQKSRWSWKRDE